MGAGKHGALKLLTDLVAKIQSVSEAQHMLMQMQAEAMGTQRLPGSGDYAYRRMSKILMVPVSKDPASPSNFTVPSDFFAEGGSGAGSTSFAVYNPNPCPVQLRGVKTGDHAQAPTDEEGWIPFPPGMFGIFSTQYPTFMSARVIAYPWFDIPDEPAPLWLNYGGGV